MRITIRIQRSNNLITKLKIAQKHKKHLNRTIRSLKQHFNVSTKQSGTTKLINRFQIVSNFMKFLFERLNIRN